MLLTTETKEVAISEVSIRNDILSESLDKMRNELLSNRRTISQLESDKYDIENEAIRLKRELKVFEQNIGLLREEKEQLI